MPASTASWARAWSHSADQRTCCKTRLAMMLAPPFDCPGKSLETCPNVIWPDLTYPSVACLGAMLSNLREAPVAILNRCLEARLLQGLNYRVLWVKFRKYRRGAFWEAAS